MNTRAASHTTTTAAAAAAVAASATGQSPQSTPLTKVRSSRRDGKGGTGSGGESSLLAGLVRAIGYLFIHAPATTTTTGDGRCGGEAALPKGDAIAVHTLHKLFLFCGVKRHRCEGFLADILTQLLSMCFPSPLAVKEAPATAAASPPPTGKKDDNVPSTPVATVRRLWTDAASWASSSRHTVQWEELLLSQLSPGDRAALLAANPALAATAAAAQQYVLCTTQAVAERLISKLFAEQLRGQMVTLTPIPRWRMACRIVNDREAPIVVLCGGTSGSGKSTLASLVAAQLGIAQVLSTDTIRQLLRSNRSSDAAAPPELFVSTYEAYKVARGHQGGNPRVTAEDVVAAYRRQADLVIAALDKTLESLIARRQSVVVEGVHLLPAYMAAKQREFWSRRVACLAVLVQIRKEERHRERFSVRAQCLTLNPEGNKYVSNLGNIRTIQAFLCREAERLSVLTINNTNVDKSLMVVHHALLQLLDHIATEGWPSGKSGAGMRIRAPVNVNAKKMLHYLREHRKEETTKMSRRAMAQRLCCARHSEQDARLGGVPLSCDHPKPPGATMCEHCSTLWLLTATTASRTHSAELLTTTQRHRLDTAMQPPNIDDAPLAPPAPASDQGGEEPLDPAAAADTTQAPSPALPFHEVSARRSKSYGPSFAVETHGGRSAPSRGRGSATATGRGGHPTGSGTGRRTLESPEDDEDETGSLLEAP